MASGGSSGRTSSGKRSFDFGADDVLCSYDDFSNQDPSNGKRPDPAAKDYHESKIRPLVNVYGQQDVYPKEEIISAVEKCMKKYADNLLRHLEGISGRLSQLEVYCYKLERSIGEFQADMIRDNSEADTKLKSLEKHLQEVHRSIQILRDKQELAETQNELSKFHFVPKDSAGATRSQKNEEVTAPASIPESKRYGDTPEMPSQHLALALPHQIAATTAHPIRAPDQNQHSMQQQQQQQHGPYMLNQTAPYYSQQGQALQPELHYIQARPQIQDPSSQTPPPTPQQQTQVVNQTQPQQQPYPQYQQQWPQASQQQFTQQVVAPNQQPPSQAQIVRSRTPPNYPYPPQQSASPETFSYATIPQSGGTRSEPVTFGYGALGTSISISSQPQHQANSQGSFGPPLSKSAGGYLSGAPYPPQSNIQGYSAVYGIDPSRVQNYQPGSYPPPGNVPSRQSSHMPPGNNTGLQHPGSLMMRSHPYADIIEKAVSMGFPREQVASVINRMGDSGQQIDFNALLDRLNSHPAPGGPPRAWSS